MNRLPGLLLPTLTLLLLLPMAGSGAGGGRTLAGEYTSGYGNGSLEAVFTPAGEGSWEVSFRFTFGGRERTYSGTAAGSLDEGELEGRVETPNGSRKFTFRGEFDGGRFRGTHAEIYGGREHKTGTLTLAE